MIETIDLHRHGIFEASAGTGKTYTIGKIVLRLLRERVCRLENILVVTFTDKATGELKDRLRLELETTITESAEAAEILQPELDQFDVASISTIHGFCLRVLQDYATDLGEDVAEFAQDATIFREVLRDIQRQHWPKTFGPRLADALRAASYDRDGAKKFDDQALDIASRYRPERGHRLLPPESEVIPADHIGVLSLTVRRLTQVRDERMLSRGVMSFDDLIQRVARGLDPGSNPRASSLLTTLRERYKVAIVDEFQDTDSLQWSIFRRIFLEGEAGTRLFVVGDPKQAIYGFRGADLPTYFRAVQEMSGSHAAAEYPLLVNWRSSPGMIDALNRLFDAGRFFPSATPRFRPVDVAPAASRRANLSRDDSDRPPLTIVDVDDQRKASDARRQFARFTAAEIDRLLHSGPNGSPLIEIGTAGRWRPLRASDICLLVFKRKEADDVVRALTRRNIPYSFYKSGTVRGSAEARDLGYILAALAEPEDESQFVRAALTMFFRVAPLEIMKQHGMPANHPARILFQSWKALADERRWSEFFTSLIEETGILFHERTDSEHARRLATLRLLVGRLQFAAYQRNLDLFGLIDVLEAGDVDSRVDDDFEPQGTDAPRVQIITIHSAKGLEFPVVFLAGGFTNPRKASCIPYREDDGNLVFDLALVDSDAAAKPGIPARVERDQLEETRRLYYVALTRAQFKLYVPWLDKKPRVEKHSILTLLKPAIEASDILAEPTLAQRIAGTSLECIVPLTISKGDDQVPNKPEAIDVERLLPAVDPTIERRRIQVQSFTALHRLAKRAAADEFGDRPDRRDETPVPAVEASDPFRGAEFGELVHEIFEHIDFAEVKAARTERDLETGPAGKRIADAVQRSLPRLVTRPAEATVEAQCRRLLQTLVWRALRTPLSVLGGRLCDLPVGDCLREIEFLYPQADAPAHGEAFTKGYIDLVFRWGGAFYLLDWKSNLLPAYDPASLDRAMDELGYRLQAKLYREALVRWLTPMRSRVKGGARFGGAFYVFLRGLNGVDDRAGIFYGPPDRGWEE
jgi:exodeoxyribonuclease V beta subunit